jgi:hypothetical protein
LTVENTEDNHLEEASHRHEFESEEQKQAWLRSIQSIQALEGYCDNRYDEFGNEKPQDYLNDLNNQYHFKTLIDTEEIWFYDENKGIYLPNGEHIIKASLQSQFGRELTIKKTNEAIAQIQRSTYVSRDAFDPDILWIATTNCMVNLQVRLNHLVMNLCVRPIYLSFAIMDMQPEYLQNFSGWLKERNQVL